MAGKLAVAAIHRHGAPVAPDANPNAHLRQGAWGHAHLMKP